MNIILLLTVMVLPVTFSIEKNFLDSISNVTRLVMRNVKTVEAPLSDLEVNKMVWFFPIRLRATQGKFEDIRTLKLLNLETLSVGNSINIATSLKFDRLVLRFGHYVFQGGLSDTMRWSGGPMLIHVRKNLINANVTVQLEDSKCNISEVHINLRQWHDFALDVSGFGAFNRLVSRLMEPLANIFNNMFREVAEQYIVKDIKEKNEMCSSIFQNLNFGI